MSKTIAEIDALKADWKADPIWDIEETEGFEDHKEELLAWRLKFENEQKYQEWKRVKDKALCLQCSVAMVIYIEQLERRILELEQWKNRDR